MVWHKRKTTKLIFWVVLNHSVLQQSAARTDTPLPLFTTITEHQAKALSASFYTARNLSTQLILKIPSQTIKISPKKNTVIAWFDPDTGLLHHQQIIPVTTPPKNKRLSFYNKYIILLHKPCIHQEVDHSRSFYTAIPPFVKKQDSDTTRPPITVNWEANDTSVLLFPGKDYSLFTTAKASRQWDNENAVMTSSDQEPIALCWKDTNNHLQQTQLSTNYLEPATDDSSDYLLAFLARHAGVHTIVTSYTNRNGEKVYSVIDRQGLKHTYTYEELHQLYNDLHQINMEKALPENFSVNLPAGGGETPESWFTRYPRFPVNLPRLLAILTENQKLREQLIKKLREGVPARQVPRHDKAKRKPPGTHRKTIRQGGSAVKDMRTSARQEIIKAIYSRAWPQKDITAVDQLGEDASDVFELEKRIIKEKFENHQSIMEYNQKVNDILKSARRLPSLSRLREEAIPNLCGQAFDFTYAFFFIHFNNYMDKHISTGDLAFKLIHILPSIVKNKTLFSSDIPLKKIQFASQSSLLLSIAYVLGEVVNNLFASWGSKKNLKLPANLIQEFSLEESEEESKILFVIYKISELVIDFWISLMPLFDSDKTWTSKEAQMEEPIKEQLNSSTRAFTISTHMLTVIKGLPGTQTDIIPINALINTLSLNLKHINNLCNIAKSVNKAGWDQLLKDPLIANRYLHLVVQATRDLHSTVHKIDEIDLNTAHQDCFDQINRFINISKTHINKYIETEASKRCMDDDSLTNCQRAKTAIQNMEEYQLKYKKLYDSAIKKQELAILALVQADDKEREKKIKKAEKMQRNRKACVKSALSMIPKPEEVTYSQTTGRTYSEKIAPLSLWEAQMTQAAFYFFHGDIVKTEECLESACENVLTSEYNHLLFITYCEKISMHSDILRKTARRLMDYKKPMEHFEKFMEEIELETVETILTKIEPPLSIDKNIRVLHESGITPPTFEKRHAYVNYANKTLDELQMNKDKLNILFKTLQNTADKFHRQMEDLHLSISNPVCQSYIDFTVKALERVSDIERWLHGRDKKIEAALQKNKALMKLIGIYGRKSGFTTPAHETVVTLKAKELGATDISEDTSIESLCLALTLCMPRIPSTLPEPSKPGDSQKMQLPENVKDSLVKMLQQMKTRKDDHLRSEASAW